MHTAILIGIGFIAGVILTVLVIRQASSEVGPRW